MVSDIQRYGRKTVAVDAIPEVRFTNGAQQYEAMANVFKQSAADLTAKQEDIKQKSERRFFLQKKSQASRAMLELTTQYQSDPDGLATKLDEYRTKYVEDVQDPVLADELGTAFDLDRDAAVMRATHAQQKRVTDDLQSATIDFINTSTNDVLSDAPDLFSSDASKRYMAQSNLTVKLADIEKSVNRLDPGGLYIFSPEMRANASRQIMDQALTAGILGRITESSDPNTDMHDMISGKFKEDIAGLGSLNPLSVLSPNAKEQAIVKMEKIIAERAGASKRSWQEFEANLKVQMATDPTSVDLPSAFAQWQEKAAGVLTPEVASDINVSYSNLLEAHAKATKDYRGALPYMTGQSVFDGTDQSKKDIESGYELFKKRGEPMANRAKWLTDVNINQVPTDLVNEMESNLQAALMKGDVKLAADLAETYEVIQTSGPVMIGDLNTKLDDRSQAAIMRMRDLVRIGGVGPEAFKEIRRIMDADPTTLDERKKDLTEFQKSDTYRSLASSAVDPSIFTLAPSEQSAIMGQAAVDYRKIFETKYLATGDKKYAKEATEKLIKGMYAKTQFSKDGYMRMPPEVKYAIPNDTDNSWMKADLEAAYEAMPGYNPDDMDRLQLVADPRADFKTSQPEYLVILSDTAGDRFDSTGYVWKPDVEARTHFLRLKQQGKLGDQYLTKVQGLNAGYDYGKFIRDWNKGAFKRDVSQMPVEYIYDNGIIQQESGGKQFDPIGRPLTSNKGAVGIGQIMPGTGPEAAKLAGLPWDEKRLKTDSKYNRDLGLAYFKKQVEDFGDVRLAIMAYNAGPGNMNSFIQKYGDPRKGQITIEEFIKKVPFKETRNYVTSITNRLNKNAG